jgi:hypothetical protein
MNTETAVAVANSADVSKTNAADTRDDYTVTTDADKGVGKTKAGEPILCFDREGFVNNALCFVDWDLSDERVSTRGPYKTTGQQSFYCDDRDGNSIQINFSANFFPKDRVGTKAPKSGKDAGPQQYHLSEPELVALDGIAVRVATTDMARGAKLMTIREVHKLTGGISWDQILLAKTALTEFAGK